jgi:putative transposase
MVRKKYTEEQIIAVLKEAEAGTKLPDLCRKYGMSDATYYNWKAKYSGMTTSDLKRLKSLEEENRRLKQIVAEQALDNRALKELLSKNF